MILMVIIDVTKFIISKNIKGLWYVQLKSSIDITHHI
jgi:hypothetical protein